MERSPEMLAALLGVFKAGGAYVPLEPTSPLERLTFMMAESGGPRIVCIDNDWPEIEKASDQNPAGEVTSKNLAYVIYTSRQPDNRRES